MEEQRLSDRMTGEEPPEDGPSDAADPAEADEGRVAAGHDAAEAEEPPITES